MNIGNTSIRARWTEQLSEDAAARETGAICTAFAWLALYGIAMTGSIFSGSWQHKHETPVVAAAGQALSIAK